ncbi:ankyrin repeat domain-containing protein [Neisseria leonii]|uniref:Ankyrin repeat domain-containing protein n=2 Tax=Neisseria leonii TaxID=2995413 RepID=A0AAQ3V3Y9_9NEIS
MKKQNEKSELGVKMLNAFDEADFATIQEIVMSGKRNLDEITEVEHWNWLHKVLFNANFRVPPKKTIDYLIGYGIEVNAQDCYGMTPLHYALRAGNADAAIALLEAGADPNIPNIDNLRPLSMAGYTKDRLDVLELMLKNGGNVHNIINDNETILESWKPNSVSSQWQIDIYELMKKYA